jgi:ferric-dicitrate binding protein FerR (iron transport regulator)
MRAERRRLLVGSAALAVQMAFLRQALAQGAIPPGMQSVRGQVLVNDVAATKGTGVLAGDLVSAGSSAQAVFVIGKDAVLLRGNSRVAVEGERGSPIAAGLRLISGAILSVFSPGPPRRVQTQSATIGIRGTAIYVEVEPKRTYVCTCYGTVELASVDDPAQREVLSTKHHEQPRYIMARGAPQMLMRAPMLNHTDAEVTMLEALLGRKPPFVSQPGYQPGKY